MKTTQNPFMLFSNGLKDCFCGILSTLGFIFSKEPDSRRHSVQRSSTKLENQLGYTISDILWQCTVFGSIFGVSNLIFNYILLQRVLLKFIEYMGEELGSADRLQTYLYYEFCLCWICPLLGLSKILHYIWYQDIAKLTLSKSGIKENTSISISEFYANQIQSFILQIIYCFQSCAVYLLPLNPYIQDLWYLFHLSLLSSLYAFDYKWVYMGWTLKNRIDTMAQKWPYFLGFGLPLATITIIIPSFIQSMIVFAMFFPIYITSSTVTNEGKHLAYSHPLNSFIFADFLSNAFVKFVMILLGTRTRK